MLKEDIEKEKKKQEEAKIWQQVFQTANHILHRTDCEKDKDGKNHFYGYYDDGQTVRRFDLGQKQDSFEKLMQTSYHLTLQSVGKEVALPLDNELDRFDKNKESLDSYFRRQHEKYKKLYKQQKMYEKAQKVSAKAWDNYNKTNSNSNVFNKEAVNKIFDNIAKEKNNTLHKKFNNVLNSPAGEMAVMDGR